MASCAVDEPPVRGTKRQTSPDPAFVTKKARYTISPPGSNSSGSLSSTFHNEDDEVQRQSNSGFVETPHSPLSAKPSPGFPCRLKTLECPHEGCEKSFNRPVRLQEHLRSHTNERIHVCPHDDCGKDFLRDTHLKHHVKSAHSDVREYVCSYDTCDKSFVTNTRLKRHLAAHEGREKFMCKECGQSFRKHATLQRHELALHEGKAAHICDEGKDGTQCGAGFDTAAKLRNHKGREHGSKQYQCTICEQAQPFSHVQTRFSTYSDLQAHNSEVHPPTCFDCGMSCGSVRELKQHNEIHHGQAHQQSETQPLSERKIHKCLESDCDKSFTKKGNLKMHMKQVHSGEKFLCGAIEPVKLNHVHGWDGSDACGRGFGAKATLEEHVRTAHLGMGHSRKGKDWRPKKGKVHHKPTAIDLITGYQENSQRNIPCLVPGCAFAFIRNYDLDVHLRSRHGLDDLEIHRLHVAPATDDFGDFDEDSTMKQEGDFPHEEGGQFWLGGGEQNLARDEWFSDFAQMRALIDDEEEDGEEMAIDPALC